MRLTRLVSLAIISLNAVACSDAGIGLAHHPLDCAIGIAWGDCLPGTPGYNGAGGQLTRANETKQQVIGIRAQLDVANALCIADMNSQELDLIRSKVQLYITDSEAPPPFEFASNNSFPTENERTVIAKWATLRDVCHKRRSDISVVPASSSPLQTAFLEQDRSFAQESAGRVGELVLALYQERLTYGEFAQKRYEISRDAAIAERQFRQASLNADQERQLEAEQLTQQRFQTTLGAWSSYMQSVRARQPQTVYLQGSVGLRANCTSRQSGTIINTNCY